MAQATVFVIDDDQAVRDSLGMLLRSMKIDSQLFASAQEFLDAYDADWNGCIVLDIRMPGMSGMELHRHLVDQQLSMPVIFVTGHGDVPMAVEALALGLAVAAGARAGRGRTRSAAPSPSRRAPAGEAQLERHSSSVHL